VLQRLSISNFALVQNAEIEFKNGLNIITGESGSGKSLMVDALQLLLGNRWRSNDKNEKKCKVEGCFVLTESLSEFLNSVQVDDWGHQIILRRELWEGRSRNFINDSPVSLTVLKQAASRLMDLHHQEDTTELLEADFQQSWLDEFLKHPELKTQYQQEYANYKKQEAQLNSLNSQLEKRNKEADYIQFQLNEMDALNLKPGAYESWLSEAQDLEQADRYSAQWHHCADLLLNGEHNVIAQIRTLEKQFQDLRGSETETLKTRLNQIRTELQDIASDAERMVSRYQSNPQRLTQLQENIYTFQKLMKKHGVTDEAAYFKVWQSYQEFNQTSAHLTNERNQIEAQLTQQYKNLQLKGKALSAARQDCIQHVEPQIALELQKLGMPHAQIKFQLKGSQSPKPSGCDDLTICWSTNKGFAVQPIQTIASGGERARLMLALKAQRAAHMLPSVLVFDEIDTGVSGGIADRLGRLMQELSKRVQVISISHLPQIASKATHHIKIYKKESAHSTETFVKSLTDQERLEEIAAMLSNGEITQKALENAAQLMQANN